MRYLIEKDVRVPMRDTVELATDVYRPDSSQPVPVLLQRLPYDKEFSFVVNFAVDVQRALRAGYAVVVQDTRGRFASQGRFEPFAQEAADGADTVEWAAGQGWSSGRVGTFGASYVGATQWLAASGAPARVQAMAPFFTASDPYGWAYRGGAFELGFCLSWALRDLGLSEAQRQRAEGIRSPRDVAGLVSTGDRITELYRRLPLTDVPELRGVADYYFDWLDHPEPDAYWERLRPKASTACPAIHVAGWYDLFLAGGVADYEKLASIVPQTLVIGPWSHGVTNGQFPELDFGLRAGQVAVDVVGLQLGWFDRWLKDSDGTLPASEAIVFIQGTNVWTHERSWPPPDAHQVEFYLDSSGSANTGGGDGRLIDRLPAQESLDAFVYDPLDPVPTHGGATYFPDIFLASNAGPRDQRAIESRPDVLCYTTEPLAQPVTTMGAVQAVLFVSSSAGDTDFTAKLVDVWPDGRAMALTDGILRARYRESITDPGRLQPGTVYEITINIGPTAVGFGAGHRIRLEVSSSNFPRFNRNTNTGGCLANDRFQDIVQARNRIHHSSRHPSRLLLPVTDHRDPARRGVDQQ